MGMHANTSLRHRATTNLSAQRPRDWREDAACGGEDPELFFPVRPAGPAAEAAKLICNGTYDRPGCPVQVRCRQWADQHGIIHGVWGGESEAERQTRLALPSAHPGANRGGLAVCDHCGHGFTRRRHGQRFCSHRCHHQSMVAQPGHECGTITAAGRHRRRGEPVDDACRLAEALDRAQRRATRQQQQVVGG
jgi:WhiB family redox-sensing transcriptional regulator